MHWELSLLEKYIGNYFYSKNVQEIMFARKTHLKLFLLEKSTENYFH